MIFFELVNSKSSLSLWFAKEIIKENKTRCSILSKGKSKKLTKANPSKATIRNKINSLFF